MVPLDKQFYQETLPEAICCCLQPYLLLISVPLIEKTELHDLKKEEKKMNKTLYHSPIHLLC